jgi:dTDP-4-amino-4,6-dideoxygalactose transaminase
MQIPFNKPAHVGNEDAYVIAAINNAQISGDGPFTRLCHAWFESHLNCSRALLTPSCTQALEMAAILLDIQPGDEIIMPSYTFVTTANAFAMRGAKIVFVDLRPDTLNIDETLIEAAITPRTKAIVPVHYAGVSCHMEAIIRIAMRHRLVVIEDAAQSIMATYQGNPLGTLGQMGVYSFHETKNITSGGEGGLLIINDVRFAQRAEIIREKGTNRSQFFRGLVDKYTWVDLGSSYLPSELQAAYLWGQLENAAQITDNRLSIWNVYDLAFADLQASGKVVLPTIPGDCGHNGHIYYLKCHDLSERTKLLAHLKQDQIQAVFHYVPLHSSPAGERFGRFHGLDCFTTRESERLVRLPLWYQMEQECVDRVVASVCSFFG